MILKVRYLGQTMFCEKCLKNGKISHRKQNEKISSKNGQRQQKAKNHRKKCMDYFTKLYLTKKSHTKSWTF